MRPQSRVEWARAYAAECVARDGEVQWLEVARMLMNPREREFADMLCDGMSVRQAAKRAKSHTWLVARVALKIRKAKAIVRWIYAKADIGDPPVFPAPPPVFDRPVLTKRILWRIELMEQDMLCRHKQEAAKLAARKAALERKEQRAARMACRMRREREWLVAGRAAA